MANKNVIANRYEVVEHIGQGGMADVFRAVDTILNREVAIKILRADLSTDAVSILRFEREAQAATALSHPNIVEIYDVGDYKGHHYIVMEYVPGKTLKQVIRSRGPLLNEEAVDIMKQLTSAVAEAHSRGIIHRDIKPQNVIVKADGSIKVLDFGIAMAKGSMQLTQANNVMGSVHYLAPELAKGEPASYQSDIYALGIVFFEMLTGDVPFKADQAVQVALKHMRDSMVSIRSINPEVPQSIENIITRATAKEPSQRYRSCAEMWQDLSTCLREDRINEDPIILSKPKQQTTKPKTTPQPQPQPKQEPTPPPEEPKKNKIMPILLGILGVVGVLGIVFGLMATGVIDFGPSKTVVPDLSGYTLEEAKEICDQENLVLDTLNVDYALTENIEKGRIFMVDPEIGTTVDVNSTIHVTVSSGIGVRMPDFVEGDRNIAEVQEYLSENYPLLKITVQEEDSDKTPGTIIRQEGIEANTLFSPEVAGEIILTYSKYPTLTIPNDILGKNLNDAIAQLEGMGIVVRVSNLDTSGLSPEELDKLQYGVVIESDPMVGNSYTQRDDNYVILYYY